MRFEAFSRDRQHIVLTLESTNTRRIGTDFVSGGLRDYASSTSGGFLLTAKGEHTTDPKKLINCIRKEVERLTGRPPAAMPPGHASGIIEFRFDANLSEPEIVSAVSSAINQAELHGEEINRAELPQAAVREPPIADDSIPTERVHNGMESEGPLHFRRARESSPNQRRSGRRMRVRKAYVYLGLLIVTFALGLESTPGMNLAALALLSLVFSAMTFGSSFAIFRLLKGNASAKVVGVFILLILAGAAYQNQAALSGLTISGVFQSGDSAISNLASSYSPPAPSNWLVANPSFENGSARIDYPPDYGALANFTLALINKDRASAGVGPVSLSPIPSGQQHADSLDYYGTIGHWDVQGYKPYMRYTLLGGTGYVAENAALGYCTDSTPSSTMVTPTQCNTQTVENGLNGSEYSMMYADTTCCNNGHRDNILSPSHNRVSIGIAYNSTTDAVYLVEDFEDYYFNSFSLQVSGGVVTLQGSTSEDLTGWTGGSSGASISVYYDPLPAGIPASELSYSTSCSQFNELNEPSSCQYQGAYNAGQQISTVLAPCPGGYTCGSGNFIYAETWQEGSGSFRIVFSMSGLESAHGTGVYTLYLWPAGNPAEPITSLSIFI